jgi:hypothetical protein
VSVRILPRIWLYLSYVKNEVYTLQQTHCISLQRVGVKLCVGTEQFVVGVARNPQINLCG